MDRVYEVKIDAKVPSKGGCCLLNKILSFGCTASTLFGLFMSIYNINTKLTEHQRILFLNFCVLCDIERATYNVPVNVKESSNKLTNK